MLSRKRKRICLPYGDLVTKIFEHTGLNLEGEDYEEDVTNIGEETQGMIRYDIIYGKVIKKPFKGNKVRVEEQEQ